MSNLVEDKICPITFLNRSKEDNSVTISTDRFYNPVFTYPYESTLLRELDLINSGVFSQGNENFDDKTKEDFVYERYEGLTSSVRAYLNMNIRELVITHIISFYETIYPKSFQRWKIDLHQRLFTAISKTISEGLIKYVIGLVNDRDEASVKLKMNNLENSMFTRITDIFDKEIIYIASYIINWSSNDQTSDSLTRVNNIAVTEVVDHLLNTTEAGDYYRSQFEYYNIIEEADTSYLYTILVSMLREVAFSYLFQIRNSLCVISQTVENMIKYTPVYPFAAGYGQNQHEQEQMHNEFMNDLISLYSSDEDEEDDIITVE